MLPVLLRIGNFSIHTYGVLVAIGFLLGLIVASKRAESVGVDKKHIYDLAFWVLLFGLIGGRLMYIIVEWRYFLMAPLSYIFSGGGFVFYGGFIAGFVAGGVYIKKHGLNFWQMGDAVAPAIALGHFFGRLGCTSAGCCYGKPTNSWLHIVFHNPQAIAEPKGVPLVPTQPLEAGFLLSLFIFLVVFTKKKKFEGQIFLLYLILYAVWRFFIEFYRGDPRGHFLFFSTSQLISIVVFMVAIYYYIKFQIKSR